MPFIRTFSIDEARGLVKRELEKAIQRAGRIWNIVDIMTPNGRILKASMEMYGATMFADSPLSRRQREMMAVVVSRENACIY